MKKALVVLLILAVAGGVFAQELTWSGAVKTGLNFSKAKDAAGETRLYSDDADVPTGRADLDITYAAENYGAKVGLRSDDFTSLGVRQAYVWYTFFDLVNVKAGKIDDAVWNTMGAEDWNLSNGAGARVEVTPSAIEGLNLGVFINYYGAGAAATPSDYYFQPTIGVSYSSDRFDAAVAFRIDSDNDVYAATPPVPGKDDDGVPYITDPDDIGQEHQAIFGFSLKLIPKLKLIAEGNFFNLGGWSDYGLAWLNETVEYQISDPLAVGAVFTEKFWGQSAPSGKAYLKVKPYVSYQVNEPISVGLEVPIAYQKDGIDYSIGAKPWVKYAFADNAFIKSYYALDITKIKSSDSTYTHTFQLDFVVSF
jgi:hypothetical protein